MAVLFAILFLVLWHRGRMANYVLAFAVSYFFFAIGYVVTQVLDSASTYTWHVTQFFYTLAMVSTAWGLARRAGQPPMLGAYLLVYFLAAVSLGVSVAITNDISSRLVIVNIAYGVIALMATMILLAAPNRTGIDRLIIAVQAVIAAQFFIRPSLTLLIERNIPAEAYRESFYYAVLSLSVSLVSVISAMVLIGACIYDQIRSVRRRAELDMLTNLRTRRAFENDVVAMIERAKLEDKPVSLVVADIDHFKAVNDVWGHQVGDRAIATFGRIIADTIRDQDIAGRIGGEEFCVLAWNCEGGEAVAMADRIRHALEWTAIEGMSDDHRLTASFGVAGRREGEGYGKLFARSDAALYRAKEAGRNRAILDEVKDANPVSQLVRPVVRKAEAGA